MKLKESKKRDKFVDLARQLKNLENAGDDDNNLDDSLRTIPGGFVNVLGNKRTSDDYSDYFIIKIGQNTEKSPEDLRKLAFTQNTV